MGRKKKKRIGVLVELTREFGRGICKGITAFASEVGDIDPVFISPKNLSRRKYLKSFDGFIARVMTEEIAAALASTGKPVIDVYYDKPRDGFASNTYFLHSFSAAHGIPPLEYRRRNS